MNKTILSWMLALATAGLATPTQAATESKLTVIIRPDGTCQVRTETSQPRPQVESQVKAWERYKAMSDLGGLDEPKPAADATAAAKPLTDSELADKLRTMMADNSENFGGDDAPKIESVEVDKDSVRTIATRPFDSLEKMLAGGLGVWAQGGINFAGVRLEKNDQGQFQMTGTSDPRMKQYLAASRSAMKLAAQTMEFRLVLPGKVLASPFTNVQDNATWIIADPKDNASLDAFMKLYDAPVVITAELNGLKLDQPLDSREVRRTARRANGAAGDLPITDAGPGFVTEAVSLTTDTMYYFPDGEKNLKDLAMFSGETGARVQAKLFAPKGRFLRSVSGVKVDRAVDDKGRTIAVPEDDPAMGDVERFSSYTSFNSGESSQPGPAQMDLLVRLALPERDAQAIQELSGEAIAITFGKWKELTVTNFDGEIDLSPVLPGAKMTVSKLTARNQQVSAQIELKGPVGIRQLDLKCKVPGGDPRMGSNSNLSERGYQTNADSATRKLTITTYSFNSNGDTASKVSTNNVSLVVRFPEELRRERVRFKLTALDLF